MFLNNASNNAAIYIEYSLQLTALGKSLPLYKCTVELRYNNSTYIFTTKEIYVRWNYFLSFVNSLQMENLEKWHYFNDQKRSAFLTPVQK